MAANEPDTNPAFPRMKIMTDVAEEIARSRHQYPSTPSAHHGLSIIQEELFELQMEVYKRRAERDKDKMRREAIQVAATAIRFAEEICK